MDRRQFLASSAIAASMVTRRAAAQNKSVIVVGAGMAGLTAARTLHDAGYDTTLLEARKRIGGRIHTRRDLGSPTDMGAGWIHGKTGNPITNLARQYGSKIRFSDFTNIHAFFEDGRPGYMQRMLTIYGAVLQAIASPPADGGRGVRVERHVRAALKPMLQSQDDEYTLNAVLGAMMLNAGAELTDIDLYEFNAQSRFEGGDYKFLNGYDTVTYGLARGLTIDTGAPVKEINIGENGVTVATEHQALVADYVVVAVPLAILIRTPIKFTPELPKSTHDAIWGLKIGLSEKVILRFPEAFWPKDPTILIRATEDKSYYSTFFNNHLPYGAGPILTARVAGARVPQFDKYSDADAQGEVMDVLRKAFGKEIPDPTGMVRSHWFSDPFSQGAYSTYAVETTAKQHREQLTAPVFNRIFFAGEHTHPDYPSTVHGAHLSGKRAAEQIMSLS